LNATTLPWQKRMVRHDTQSGHKLGSQPNLLVTRIQQTKLYYCRQKMRLRTEFML
jgi:hypothetical protein